MLQERVMDTHKIQQLVRLMVDEHNKKSSIRIQWFLEVGIKPKCKCIIQNNNSYLQMGAILTLKELELTLKIKFQTLKLQQITRIQSILTWI
jgi:hypothetical protein